MALRECMCRSLLACIVAACMRTAMAGEAHPPAMELEDVRAAVRQKDFALALRSLGEKATSGNALAQYRLGALLLANPVAAPDPAAASAWLQKAVAAGEPRAAYLLAVIAASSDQPDQQAAGRWLEVAASGGVEQARELLAAGRLPLQFLPADLEDRAARDAALLRAARHDDVATLARLGAGQAISLQDDFGRTPLSVATLADAAQAVQWLLQHGAAPEARDRDGATALLLAARVPGGRVLPLLLQARVDVAARDSRGNTALHMASRSADLAGVRQLLDAGARHDMLNDDGDAPLDLALRAASAPVVDVLRAAGARSSRPPSAASSPLTEVRRAARDAYAGRSDLQVAASRRDPQLLSTLLKRGGITAPMRDAALLAAVEGGSTRAAEILLEAGAVASARDASGRSAVDIAVDHDDVQMLALLARRGASTGGDGRTAVAPLVRAVAADRQGAIQFLLGAGVDVDVTDASGRSALCIAAARDDDATVERLLARGASPLRRDKLGRDALGCAAGHAGAVLRRLIAAGADAQRPDGAGYSPLAIAAANGNEAGVAALLAAGAPVSAATPDGVTCLMRAVMGDHAGVVRLLLAAGADVNARDQDGETPLTLAARDASEVVVRALLAAGGEVAYRNANRATAEDIAKGLNRGAVAGLLAAK